MKLPGVSTFLEYAKNLKSNVVLVVVLVLESKGLYSFKLLYHNQMLNKWSKLALVKKSASLF